MKMPKKRNTDGSALIYVLCIMAVIVVLSLTLLGLSYSLFASSVKHKDQEQAQILAVTLSKEIRSELGYNEKEDKDGYWLVPYSEGKVDPLGIIYQCNDAGEVNTVTASAFTTYIVKNIWTDQWPYYNNEERNHSISDASIYFDMSTSNSDFQDVANDIDVQVYWEGNKDTAAQGSAIKKDDTMLSVIVTSRIGNQSCTVANNFVLTLKVLENGNELWQWSLSSRE